MTKPNILIVDDDEMVLIALNELLRPEGYEVHTSSRGSEALKKLDQDGYDLLMLDVIMPEMNGKDLSEKLKELHPGLRVLFMSGYTDDVIAQQGIYNKQVSFIQKPFSMEDIAIKIREILDQNGN